MKKNISLTQTGYDKLIKELESLEKVQRPKVIERIQSARALGDLSENNEYEDARNEQSFVEGRIKELKDMVKHAIVVNTKKDLASVNMGDIVVCEVEGEKEEYELVSSVEADPSNGKVSIDSPFGIALSGKKKGEIVKVHAPAGEIEYKILDIK